MRMLNVRILWLTISAIIIALSFFVYPKETPEETPVTQSNVPLSQNPFQPYYATATSSAFAVSGYYSRYQKTVEYEPGLSQANMCDTFIVTSVENPLTKNLKSYIEEGNTINSITQDRKLRLNIDMDAVDDELKMRILSSNENKAITLSISEKRREGKDAKPCESFVEISSP